MKHTLVGYTGFVGGNLAAQHQFDNLYNSKNIQEGFGAGNGLVIYSGMPSEKFLANANPEADFAHAKQALENIRALAPEKLVLISTVDVYPRPFCVYEDTQVKDENAPAYGKNRLALEKWVHEEYPEALIVRLPGLYGKGLKKNFIFDMITVVPAALTQAKYEELCEKQPIVEPAYVLGEGGFYRLKPLVETEHAKLKSFFVQNNFNALSFTDSRSMFQFYSLANLWKDIDFCMEKGFKLVNFATEPVAAGTLYEMLFGEAFENHLAKEPARYDMRTHYGRTFGGGDHYMADRDGVVAGIAKFARSFI